MEKEITYEKIIIELSEEHQHIHNGKDEKFLIPMPNVIDLQIIMDLFVKILFPGYFGESDLNSANISLFMRDYMHKLSPMLEEQIKRGFSFDLADTKLLGFYQEKASCVCMNFINQIPKIKKMIYADVRATFYGDPAAKSLGEIIYCYPGIRALTNHRIAHELYKMNVPLIPRIISEMAHSATGIDIHPGASIGEALAIDHGTGVVIGETCRIGRNVKIYQGVTLGALSFSLDKNGNPIKGIERHPVIEDNVIIYSGATILGRVTIGKNSIIGGNVWLTHDVPPNSKIFQRKAKENTFSDGAGI